MEHLMDIDINKLPILMGNSKHDLFIGVKSVDGVRKYNVMSLFGTAGEKREPILVGKRKFNVSDYIGKVYNRLTVVSYHGKWKDGSHAFNCLCECGKMTVAIKTNLERGNTSSCGCYWSDRIYETHLTHGRSGSTEYNIWMGIKARCNKPQELAYKWYGAKGIKVCPEWENSFETFFRDMGERPSLDLTLERRNVKGNYCKENCYWATWVQQANNKTNTVFLLYDGKKMTITDFCCLFNIRRTRFCSRYYKYGSEEAIDFFIKRGAVNRK